uniref:Putative portal protein n=1 Tax=viral metagenome TaxID=1070528 RepID=A0A6M3IK73_9ZZZZ
MIKKKATIFNQTARPSSMLAKMIHEVMFGDGKDPKFEGEIPTLHNTIIRKSLCKTSKGMVNETFTSAEYLTPPYDEDQILIAARENIWFHKATKVKVEDAFRLGFTLNPKDEMDEALKVEQRKKIQVDLSNVNSNRESLEDVICRCGEDFSIFGRAAIEVPRVDGKMSDPLEIRHLAVYRLQPHSKCFNSGDDAIPLFKYVVPGRDPKYFKLFGAEGDYNAKTGLKANDNTEEEDIANEIIYITNYHPKMSPYFGISIVVPLWSAVVGFAESRLYQLYYFLKQGTVKSVSLISGPLTPEQQNYVKDWMEAETVGESNISLVINSPEPDSKLDYKPMQDSPTEASFLKFGEMTREEILAGTGVPPERIGLPSKGALGGNLMEGMAKVYIQTVITPLQRPFEEVINKLLFTEGGIESAIGWEIEFNTLDVVDKQLVLQTAIEGLRAKGITIGEFVKQLGLETEFETEEDANERLIGTGYQPANAAPVNIGTGQVLSQVEDTMAKIQKLVNKK